MDRESFLARASKPATTTVTLDDGSTLQVRKLSQAEVETIKAKYASEEKALAGYRYIVARCAVDGDGKRIFSDADTDKLADVDFEAVQHIAAEVMKFSGLRIDPKNA